MVGKTADKLKLYLASPLFSDAERKFNVELRDVLKEYFDVYLPQEDGGLLVNMIQNGIPLDIARRKVFMSDVRAIDESDMVLIVLDGRTVDEGAAFELGYAFAKDKPCIGLRTDPRQLLACGNNPMIEQPLRKCFNSTAELVMWLELPSSFVSEHAKA